MSLHSLQIHGTFILKLHEISRKGTVNQHRKKSQTYEIGIKEFPFPIKICLFFCSSSTCSLCPLLFMHIDSHCESLFFERLSFFMCEKMKILYCCFNSLFWLRRMTLLAAIVGTDVVHIYEIHERLRILFLLFFQNTIKTRFHRS